jgi:hypothetical protein
MDIGAIEKKALHLPLRDRARLAQRLIESLDELSDAEAESLWLDEAERRAREIDQDAVALVSADELERRIQARR